MPVRIEVREDYQLSAQYTPENLMREYYDSLSWRRSKKRGGAEHASDIPLFIEDGNIMCLTLQDTVVAQGKKDSVVELLTSVFNDRFHVPVEVRVVYEKPKESSLKYNDLKLRRKWTPLWRETRPSGRSGFCGKNPRRRTPPLERSGGRS